MTRLAPHRLGAALALLALTGACADVGPDVEGLAGEVARQRQIWEARRPGTYTMELERQCFCAPDARGPVKVVVEGVRVTARTYSDSGDPVPEVYAALFPTVDGLFDILEEAIERSAERIDVVWQAESGAPSSFFIDYSRNMADEELGYGILAGPS